MDLYEIDPLDLPTKKVQPKKCTKPGPQKKVLKPVNVEEPKEPKKKRKAKESSSTIEEEESKKQKILVDEKDIKKEAAAMRRAEKKIEKQRLLEEQERIKKEAEFAASEAQRLVLEKKRIASEKRKENRLLKQKSQGSVSDKPDESVAPKWFKDHVAAIKKNESEFTPKSEKNSIHREVEQVARNQWNNDIMRSKMADEVLKHQNRMHLMIFPSRARIQ